MKFATGFPHEYFLDSATIFGADLILVGFIPFCGPTMLSSGYIDRAALLVNPPDRMLSELELVAPDF